MTLAVLHDAAAALVGSSSVRQGASADAVEGVVPQLVVEPPTVEALSAMLAWASRERLSVVVRGSGTKLGWGPAPRANDLLISMSRLNRVVAHRHGDLTATVEAGARLSDVNKELGRHAQWIPLDPPMADRVTIGGLVATNESGPRRHRYGAPRDLIIGVEFATADGRVAKGGGIVVKNVAGYDLPRLMTGSFGSLGVIVSATFKLYPLTAASRTVVVEVPAPAQLGALVGRIMSSHLTPTALEFATHPLRLYIRFESIEASVVQQCATAEQLIRESGGASRTATGSEEEELWNRHATFDDSSEGALLKVSVLPSELATILGTIEQQAGRDGYRAAGRAGLAVFLLQLNGDVEAQQRIIAAVRGSLPAGRGSAVLVRGSADLKKLVDVWGPIGDGLSIMKAVKKQFDPAGVLSPGRGPGGL